MSERYFVTGAQLGVLRGYLEVWDKHPINSAIKVTEILKEIEDKQFVGNVRNEKDKVTIVSAEPTKEEDERRVNE